MNFLRILSLSLIAVLLSSSSICLSLSPEAEKFDFQVISVSEYLFRTVRVFWDPHKNLVMIKIFEKDRFLKLESLHYDRHLDVSISLNPHSFHIYSLQDFLSKKNASAIIEVPAQSEIFSIPAYILTITEQGFEYKWVEPNIKNPISSVSLIWLDEMGTNLQTRGKSIRGYTKLETDETDIRLEHDESIIMGLRMDTSFSTSGIVLPKCISLQSEVGLLNDRPKLLGSTSHISIEWQLKCPEEGIVYGITGYNLYYCRLQSGTTCVEPETKLTYKTDNTSMVLEASINGLTPSTRYHIAGTVILGNGTESGRRELIYVTMAAPNVSTTIRPWLRWRPPPYRCGHRFGRFDRFGRYDRSGRYGRWCSIPRLGY